MKKIAVNTVKTFLKENKQADDHIETFQVGDSSFEVAFHTVLTIDEKSVFIKRVISGCFSAGKFRPEYVTPMLRATILQMCTNIPAVTMKDEKAKDGSAALDLDAMDKLYQAMNLDNLQDAGYQAMMREMVYLCGQAIDWEKSNSLSNHGTESAFRDLLKALTKKVEAIDPSELLKYAGILAEGTKNLGEDGILKGLLEANGVKAAN